MWQGRKGTAGTGTVFVIFIFLLLAGMVHLASAGGEPFSTERDENSVSDMKGTVHRLSPTSRFYVIVPDDDKIQRLYPSNLPAAFRKDGLRVRFSGRIGEIPENARLVGTPLELTGIEEADGTTTPQ
ncbi:MAG: hypothetical protein HKM86_01800 [Deltaproteobacteria bacterium]|nr:hypothetical protein [Deltaproteobacteria bacterium]